MNTQITSGAGWMVLSRLIDRSFGVISTLILARLLLPEDFGLVAMAMSVLAVIELATSFNFEVALIQRRELDRAHYDSAWTLNVLLGLLCGSVTALLAYPTALFYEEERLTAVLVVLAGAWAIGGLENIGIVDFRRRLDFQREFYFLTAKRILSFAVTLALAVSLQSYWSLVLGTVAGRLLGVMLSFTMHPFRPRLSLSAARELVRFSGWMLISNLLIVLQRKIPHAVVGRSLGADQLGVFTVASEISQLPSSDLIAPINRALFPAFSRMTDDPALLRSTFLDVIAIVVLLVVPAAVGIGAVADPLVRLLLGEKWTDAVPIMQILAAATAVSVVSSSNSSAFLSMGRPRQWSLIVGLRLAILVPLAILLTKSFGLKGAALAELVTSLIFLGISVPLVLRELQLPYRGFVSRVWRPLVASALMAGAVDLAIRALPAGDAVQLTVQLLVGVLTGLVTYFFIILVTWLVSARPHGAEAILLLHFKAMTGRQPTTKA